MENFKYYLYQNHLNADQNFSLCNEGGRQRTQTILFPECVEGSLTVVDV